MISEFKGQFRWLSNFSRCKVMLDGVTYPSVENAFQASKTLDPEERKPFEHATAGEAKRFGRRVTKRKDWDKDKLLIMEQLNTQKYRNEPYRSLLLGTGDTYLQEGNTWNDTFWGVCNGFGDNHLGHILMEIRRKLREET